MSNFAKSRPSISVIMASFNGEDVLPRTLDSFRRLIVPKNGVEFVLVDNCSTDTTGQLMKNFLEEMPGKFVVEDRPGRSWALNAGIQNASGNILLFTDDDVIADQAWLVTFLDFSEKMTKYGVFGGQIRLEWPLPPKPWQREIEYRGRTLGATPIERPSGPLVYSEVKGANFCIRREFLRDASAFDPELGVSSKGPMLAGEETDFVRRLQEGGVGVYYVKDALVRHIVRLNQVSVWSMMKRGFRNGRGAAQSDKNPLACSRIYIFGIPGYVYVQTFHVAFKSVINFLTGRSAMEKADAVSELIRVSEIFGAAFQLRNLK